MADYRLYLLNRQGRITRAIPLACETDEQAMATVHAYPQDPGVELWQLDRLVCRLGSAPNPMGTDSNPNALFDAGRGARDRSARTDPRR